MADESGIGLSTGGAPAAAPTEQGGAAPEGWNPVSPAVAATEDDTPEPSEEGQEPAGGVPAVPETPSAAGQPAAPQVQPTPQQQEIVQAAGQYMQAAQLIQQELPQVQGQRQLLEQQLAPYVQDPNLLASLPPQAQAAVQGAYSKWQQLAGREQQLRAGWAQVEQAAPILQTMYALEQRAAVLNAVGEPVAYQLLADRAAERSGDPDFPRQDMMKFLRGTPAAMLESQATKFEEFWRDSRRRERAAGRVDDMGPQGGATGRGGGRRSGGALIREAIADDLRRNPPR